MLFAISALLALPLMAEEKAHVTGRVTSEGRPVSSVRVSDGKDIVLTGADGRYALPTDKSTGLVFICPPSGFVPVSKDGLQPAFYAHLEGNSEDEVHDFELVKENQENYTVLFVTDIHLCNAAFKNDLKVFRKKAMPAFRKVAEEVAGRGTRYIINLGDLSHERYWYEYDYNLEDAYSTLLKAGFPGPMYSVPGNHDNDCAVISSRTDFDAGWLYRKVLGPEYYSVDIGNEHWIFMDDTVYENSTEIHAKPWPVGSAGSISYFRGLTQTQMDWISKDLSYVPSDKNVIICAHIPLLSDNKNGTAFKPEQLEQLSGMLSRFGKVKVYAGHMHRMQYIDSQKFPVFEQWTVSAFSGDMWESAPNRLLGIEGEEGGTFEVNFGKDGGSYAWRSHQRGKMVLRCYDLNTVGKLYRNDKNIRTQMEKFPKRNDYSKEQYRDYVLVNYWLYRDGETVEISEGGKALKVEKVNWEDPLFNIDYYVEALLSDNKVAPSQDKVPNRHMFAAKCSSAKSTVKVTVRDSEGKIIHEETMKRPKSFGPRMK